MNRKIMYLFIVGLLILPVMITGSCAKPPAPPVAQISATPSSVTIGESITFSGAASTDADGSITSYNWDYGDGNTLSWKTVTHIYSDIGAYTVKLTVTDNDGLSDTAEVSVKVVGLASIKIEATTSTWFGEPYDIYGTIKEKLEEAGFEVVPQESTDYDAILFVDYKEEKGSGYSPSGYGIPTGYGTDITCNLTLKDKAGNIIFEKEIFACTSYSVSSGGLYSDALANFEDEADFKYLGEIIAGQFNPKVVESLIQALQDENRNVRENAAEVLGLIGDARAVEPLIQALQDENYWVRANAAEALGKIGDARAVEPLIQALKDENEYVRRYAAEALGEIGDARAVEPLTEALEDEDLSVRREAAEALEKIRGE